MTLRKKSASRKSAHSRRRKSTKRSHRTNRLKSKSKQLKSAHKSKSLRHGYHRMLRGGVVVPAAAGGVVVPAAAGGVVVPAAPPLPGTAIATAAPTVLTVLTLTGATALQAQASTAPPLVTEVQQSLTHILTNNKDKTIDQKFNAIKNLLGVKFSSKQQNGVMRILKEPGENDEDKSKEILRFLIDNGKNSNEKLLAALGVGVGGSALAYMLGQSHGENKDAKSKKQQKSPRTPSGYTSQQSLNWRDDLKYASPRDDLKYASPR